MNAGDIAHGVVVCAGICSGAVAIVAAGCVVARLAARWLDRRIDEATTFAPATEAAIVEALRTVAEEVHRGDVLDPARHAQAVSAFETGFTPPPIPFMREVLAPSDPVDELAARRTRLGQS